MADHTDVKPGRYALGEANDSEVYARAGLLRQRDAHHQAKLAARDDARRGARESHQLRSSQRLTGHGRVEDQLVRDRRAAVTNSENLLQTKVT